MAVFHTYTRVYSQHTQRDGAIMSEADARGALERPQSSNTVDAQQRKPNRDPYKRLRMPVTRKPRLNRYSCLDPKHISPTLRPSSIVPPPP